MPNPRPIDPDLLDHAFNKFVTAVKDYVSMEEVKVDPPDKRPKTGNPFDDIQKAWEDFKQWLARFHKVLVGTEREIDEHLKNIASSGAEVLELTDDQYITDDVKDLIRMASEERTDIGSIISRIGAAKDIPTVFSMFGELMGLAPGIADRRKKMGATMGSLVTYYHLRVPPRSA